VTIPDHFTIDIELTNRCNADCYFCPRAATPDQGLMTPETFEAALARAVEFEAVAKERTGRDVWVSLCGLGEPLINKHAVDFARAVVDAGLLCTVSSNGSLLDETKARALIDAGVKRFDINVGEKDDEYEAIYKLPWQRTLDNLLRFRELAEGRSAVNIILVDHRNDPAHIETMRSFWSGHGFTNFFAFPLINRGGSLPLDHMYFSERSEPAEARVILEERGGAPECVWPFTSQFIGFDGRYFLCCSDWEKRVPFSSVFDRSLIDIFGPKLDYTRNRGPLCTTCNGDSVNYIADRIRAVAEDPMMAFVGPEWQADQLIADRDETLGLLEQLSPGVTDRKLGAGRVTIPVRAI